MMEMLWTAALMLEEGLLEREDVIAVVAGVPVGRSGTTNMLTIQPVTALLGKSLGASTPKDD